MIIGMVAGAMREAQDRAWAEGYQAGFDNGQCRARDRSPMANMTPDNPYRNEATTDDRHE